MDLPETCYTVSGDVQVAYQVTDSGSTDLVWAPARSPTRCVTNSRERGTLSDWGAVGVDLTARMSPTISAWTEATWSSSVRGVVGLLYGCADPATIADLMTIAPSPGAYIAQVRARRSPSKPRW
jgi:hypothetical protein